MNPKGPIYIYICIYIYVYIYMYIYVYTYTLQYIYIYHRIYRGLERGCCVLTVGSMYIQSAIQTPPCTSIKILMVCIGWYLGCLSL